MSEAKAYRCDGPDCDVMEMSNEYKGLPADTWYQLYRPGGHYWHFHNATCLRHFAEQLAPVMVGERDG